MVLLVPTATVLLVWMCRRDGRTWPHSAKEGAGHRADRVWPLDAMHLKQILCYSETCIKRHSGLYREAVFEHRS